MPVLIPTRRALFQRAITLTSAGLVAQILPTFAFAQNAANGQRIVSIGGALTEILYALHLDKKLVGIDTTSTYPSQTTQLPSVGYARTLSAEGVLALKPNLIIATEDAGPANVIKQLSASGIGIHILPAKHQFEGLLSRVKKIGELTNNQANAQHLIDKLSAEWQVTQANKITKPAVRVLFILSHTPSQIMVAGANTSAEAMMYYAGFINAATQSGSFNGYKPLTPEAVIAARPDVIVLTEQGLSTIGGVAGLLKLPGIAQTPAAKLNRIVSFDAMFLLGFGPRLPSAVAAFNKQVAQLVG